MNHGFNSPIKISGIFARDHEIAREQFAGIAENLEK